MKVLHVCPYMHPFAGGPPVVVERYCQFAAERGWEASAVSTSLYCDDDGAKLQRSLRERIAIDILPVDRPTLLGLSSRARSTIETRVRASDLVHVHTLWHPLGSMVRKVCFRYDRPYVIMPHGMLDPYSLNVNFWRKRVFMACLESTNLRGANRIVYTTSEEQRLACAQFQWLPPGYVAPLGADDPPDVPRAKLSRAFLARFDAAAGRRCLLFLGRLHPKKGLDYIFEVLPALARQFPDVFLVIAGGGSPNHVRALHRRVETGGLRERVLFTGPLDGELKWGAFANAKVFLLPSRQENFAISVAEAMRMGVPVIVSDRVNSWPFVVEADAGLVVQGDDMVCSLLKAATDLLEDRDKAKRMGQAGAAFAAERFTWSNATKRIVACYDDVLGRPRGSRLESKGHG